MGDDATNETASLTGELEVYLSQLNPRSWRGALSPRFPVLQSIILALLSVLAIAASFFSFSTSWLTVALVASAVFVFLNLLGQRRAMIANVGRALELNRTILDCSGEALRLIGPDSRVLYLNDEMVKLQHLSRDRSLGKRCCDTFPGDLCNTDNCPSKLLLGGTPKIFVEQQKREVVGGEELCVELIATPIKLGDVVVGMIESFRDVTRRRQMEAQAERLRQELQQKRKMESIGLLAAGITHNYSNMLSVIRAHAELARRKVVDIPEVAEDLVVIEEAADQANRVTRSLLAFTRQFPAENQPLELTSVLRSTIRSIEQIIPRSIALVDEIPTDSPVWIKGDEARLKQMFIDLMLNARDAVSPGGEIRCSLALLAGELCEMKGPVVQLSVQDTGVGIPEEQLTQIFEPFFTTKDEHFGTGLGLASVHGIVTDLGGRIEVDSEPGKGTRITIFLPRLDAAHLYGDEDDAAGERQASMILVVTSDGATKRFLEFILRSNGYRFLTVADTAEGLEVVRSNAGMVRMVLVDSGAKREKLQDFVDGLAGLNGDLPVLEMLEETADCDDPPTNLILKPFTGRELVSKITHMLES